MAHIYTRYIDADPKKNDELALSDLKVWILARTAGKEEAWKELQSLAAQCEKFAEDGNMSNAIKATEELMLLFAFAGIAGRPIHAFARKYCLRAYRAWMASGPQGKETDEQGFELPAPAPTHDMPEVRN